MNIVKKDQVSAAWSQSEVFVQGWLKKLYRIVVYVILSQFGSDEAEAV